MNQEVLQDRDLLGAKAGGPAALAPVISERLRSGDTKSILAYFEDQHSADIANVLANLGADDSGRLLRLLPLDERADVFGYLEADDQIDIARALGRREFAKIVAEMSPDERADLFNRLSQEQQEMLLPALAQAEREDIRKLASYPEGTAGAVMTSDYATLAPELTARQALERLRIAAPDKETIYYSYVVDEARRLTGVVSLRDLILADSSTRVGDIMDTNVICARAEDSRADVARKIARYDLIALPIINGGDALVGIVTQDDAMDVVEEEATKDFRKSGAVGGLEASLKEAGINLLYRKRVSWLVVLVFVNIFSGAGIAMFQDTIAANVALVFFLPLLIDSGGNAGSQASTLMVRALATGDISLADWRQMLMKELLVATALGVTMAVAVFSIGMLRGGPEIAIIVVATMVLIVVVGGLIGAALPFLLSRFHFDPASASGPLITSIADIIGVLIYFSIATLVLSRL